VLFVIAVAATPMAAHHLQYSITHRPLLSPIQQQNQQQQRQQQQQQSAMTTTMGSGALRP